MGSIFSRVLWWWAPAPEAEPVHIAVVGLDDAGKTTLLRYMAHGTPLRPEEALPTIGFNVETFKSGKVRIEAWDLGGQASIRPMWDCYFADDMLAVVFVVDAVDRERLGIAQEEFNRLLSLQCLKTSAFVLFLNKTDLLCSMPESEIIERWHLKEVINNKQWTVIEGCALNGKGVREAVEWIADIARKQASRTTTVV
jgi:small GTP-binding protein